MALSLSATCLAIALADERGTLSFFERLDRWGEEYVAITDEHGTIEVAGDIDTAEQRVNDLRMRAAA